MPWRATASTWGPFFFSRHAAPPYIVCNLHLVAAGMKRRRASTAHGAWGRMRIETLHLQTVKRAGGKACLHGEQRAGVCPHRSRTGGREEPYTTPPTSHQGIRKQDRRPHRRDSARPPPAASRRAVCTFQVALLPPFCYLARHGRSQCDRSLGAEKRLIQHRKLSRIN